MLLLATLPYAALLAFVYLLLTVQVVLHRYEHKAALGDAGQDSLQRAIRAHGNFNEYVPFVLVLMVMYELSGGSFLLTNIIGACLAAGRIIHAYSILSFEPKRSSLALRPVGMVLTLTALALAGIGIGLRFLMYAL